MPPAVQPTATRLSQAATTSEKPTPTEKPGQSDQTGTEIGETISEFFGSPPELAKSRAESSTHPAYDLHDHWFVPEIEKDQIQFVIAFVPDPVHTHLALVFDRSIDAMQEAAQSQGCWFDRATMPWETERHPQSSNVERRQEESKLTANREKWPGLMIFRRAGPRFDGDTEVCYGKHLFVFAVGETPTGGIHKEQFQRALRIIQHIRGDEGAITTPLYLSGPTFSGSLFSLLVAINEDLALIGSQPITAYSGTVTDLASQKIFNTEVTDKKLKINFASFQENDDALTRAFVQFAFELGYGAREIATLSEDETEFGSRPMNATAPTQPAGQSNVSDPSGVVRLHFPREISQLRAAYQASISGSSSPSDGRAVLPLDLETTGNDDDTVPSFAKMQTPLSQEAIMLKITGELHKHHTKIVLLFATDPIDQLFIAQYLRRAYPPARIGVTTPDLLLAREGDSLLHGTFGVAAYSLAVGSGANLYRTECAGDKPDKPAFPSTLSQGLYNAMIGLLKAMGPIRSAGMTSIWNSGNCPAPQAEQVPGAPYAAYGPPQDCASDCRKFLAPQVQVTILGRDGYWDLESLESATRANAQSTLKPQAGEAVAPKNSHQHVAMSFNVAILLMALIAVLHVWFSMDGTLLSLWEATAQFGYVPGKGEKPREWLLVIGALLLTLGLTLMFAARVMAGASEWPSNAVIYCLFLGTCVFAVLVAQNLAGARKSPRCALAYLAGAALMIGGSVIVACEKPSGLAWMWEPRSVHLTNGCSSLLPILLLLGGGYWWTWYGLRGMILTDSHRPRLPLKTELPSSFLRITEENTARLRKCANPLGFSFSGIAVILAGILLFRITPDWRHPIQTFEGRIFDRSYFLLLVATNSLLLWTLVKLIEIWGETRRVLAAIDRTPLRHAFLRLRGFRWATLWSSASSTMRESYRFIARELECLDCFYRAITSDRHLRIGTTLVSADLRERVRLTIDLRDQTFKKVEAAFADRTKVPEAIESYEELLKAAATTAGTVVSEALETEWKAIRYPVTANPPRFIRDQDWQLAGGPLRQVAEEFVALTYAAYLSVVIVRMRTLVQVAIGIYVALLLSISVYPFEPNPALFTIAVAEFLLGGGVVGYVYAQMHRDATLSRLTSTKEGELDGQFWFQLVGAGAVPLLTLLAGQFPIINQFVVRLLEPALQALNK